MRHSGERIGEQEYMSEENIQTKIWGEKRMENIRRCVRASWSTEKSCHIPVMSVPVGVGWAKGAETNLKRKQLRIFRY